MKLDRNIPENRKQGKGKYLLINCRKMDKAPAKTLVKMKEYYLIPVEAVEGGAPGEIDEFFLIKLRDRHALPALEAYSESIKPIDPEFAEEISQLAARSGRFSPFCKDPD